MRTQLQSRAAAPGRAAPLHTDSQLSGLRPIRQAASFSRERKGLQAVACES